MQTIMKLTLISTLLILSCSAQAQNTLQRNTNSLRADSINKEIINYVVPTGEGENVIWDFSQKENEETPDTTCISIYDVKDRILWDDNGSMATFKKNNDSLLIARMETPLFEMDYHTPIVSLTFPFGYGKTISNRFAGEGIYEGRFSVKENGTATVTADGYGLLILAEGDTLQNVLRVHTTYLSDVDVSNRYTGEDLKTLNRQTDIYRWYARGYRYAVLETTEENTKMDNKVVSGRKSTHRISPDMQTTSEDLANEDIRHQDAIAKDDVISYKLEVKSSSAELKYDLKADSHIGMTLCGAQGIVYWRHDADKLAGENYRQTIPLTGLLRGQYVIYIKVNEKIYSANVNVE